MNRPFRLFFHAPCFDGVASAAMAAEHLERTGFAVELEPVGYGSRATWLGPKDERFGVVDFLYHPDALFFADHHATSFLDEDLRRDFDARAAGGAELFYDSSAPSCATILVAVLKGSLDTARFSLLASAAAKVDSAAYPSVEEAVFPIDAAGAIRDSLAMGADGDYLRMLVQGLRRSTLDEIADRPDVRARVESYVRKQRSALASFRQTLRPGPTGIITFDYDTSHGNVSRYAPYLFEPEADYSIGILRAPGRAKITAMRNPWRDFPSVPLGRIFERAGGGGHTRVGSLELTGPAASDAGQRLHQLAAEIARSELAEAAKC